MSQENKDLNASEFLLITMHYLTDLDRSKNIFTLEKELKTTGDSIYRYLALDDFSNHRVYFSICGFWYAESLIEINETERAKEVYLSHS